MDYTVTKKGYTVTRLKPRAEGELEPLNIRAPGMTLEAGINASEGSSIPEALTVSAGHRADTIAQGVKQGVMEAVDMAAPGSMRPRLDAQRAEQAEKEAAYKGMEHAHPMATALGGALPYAGIPMSLGPVAAGAVTAGMEGLQYGNKSERATRATVGGITGGLAAKLSRVLGGYVNPELSQTQRAALDESAALGIKPRLSEVTQSPFIESVEDWSARVPGGRGVMDDFAKANQKVVNRVASRAVGQNADDFGPETIAKAQKALSKPFEDLKALGKVTINGKQVNPIEIDAGVASAADEVLKTQAKLDSRGNAQVKDLAERAQRLAGLKGRIDGETYQLLHSDLSDAAWRAYKDGDSVSAKGYEKLMKSLDAAADASLRKAGLADLADDLKTVRPQYGNFKLLTKGMIAEGGDVSPARLAQALRTKNPEGFRTGKGGDLAAVARRNEAFPPLRAGSQTFEREVTANPATAGMAAALSIPLANIATSPAVTAIPRKLGGTKGGKLLSDALLNPALRASIMGSGNSLLLPRVPVLTEN